ncbi:MAG: hypothetical protein ACLFVO_05840 [Chloroflexaceae bacterium]
MDLVHDVDNTLLPILRVLQADMLQPNEPLRLQVDLRGWKLPAKQVDQVDHHDTEKTVDTFYVDHWLTGQAHLADRSRLRWRLTRQVRVRQTTRHRLSGRVKTKTKDKIKTLVDARLAISHQRYPGALSEAAPIPHGRLKIRPKEQRTEIRVKQKYSPETTSRDTNPFVEAVSAAYQQVTLPDAGPTTIPDVPQSPTRLLIRNAALQRELQQAWKQGGKIAPYVEIKNGQMYLSLAFLDDPAERAQAYDLLQRFQAGETVDQTALRRLGQQLLHK